MTTSLTKSQQLCADLVAKARSMNNNIGPITFKSAKGQEITVVALPMDFLATILRCDDQNGTIAKLRKALVGYDSTFEEFIEPAAMVDEQDHYVSVKKWFEQSESPLTSPLHSVGSNTIKDIKKKMRTFDGRNPLTVQSMAQTCNTAFASVFGSIITSLHGGNIKESMEEVYIEAHQGNTGLPFTNFAAFDIALYLTFYHLRLQGYHVTNSPRTCIIEQFLLRNASYNLNDRVKSTGPKAFTVGTPGAVLVSEILNSVQDAFEMSDDEVDDALFEPRKGRLYEDQQRVSQFWKMCQVKAMDSGWRVTFRAVKCGVLASLDPYAKANGGRGRIRYSATEVLRLKTFVLATGKSSLTQQDHLGIVAAYNKQAEIKRSSRSLRDQLTMKTRQEWFFSPLESPLVEDEDEQVIPEAVATSTSGPVGGAAKKLKAVKADAGAGGDGKKRKAAKVDANAIESAGGDGKKRKAAKVDANAIKPVPTKRKASRSSSSSSTIDNAMMSPLDKWMQEWGPL